MHLTQYTLLKYNPLIHNEISWIFLEEYFNHVNKILIFMCYNTPSFLYKQKTLCAKLL